MSTNKPEWLPYLDLLRIALSMAVVIYHYYWYGPLNNSISLTPSHIDACMTLSFAVQIFFMVSGFVIAGSMHNRSASDFMSARFLRLAPTLGICSVVTFTLVNSVQVHPALQADVTRFIYSTLTIPLFATLGLDPSLWSLTYEIRFYMLATIALWKFKNKAVYVLTAAMVALDGIPLILAAIASSKYLTLNTGFSYHGCFFALGAMMHIAFTRKRCGVFMYSIFCFLLLSCAIRTNQDLISILARLNMPTTLAIFSPTGFILVTLGSSLLLISIKIKPTTSARIWHTIKILGRASFPLYAIHQLVGYWAINLAVFEKSIDIRPALIMCMLIAAAMISEWFEPFVRAQYTRAIKFLRQTLTATY